MIRINEHTFFFYPTATHDWCEVLYVPDQGPVQVWIVPGTLNS